MARKKAAAKKRAPRTAAAPRTPDPVREQLLERFGETGNIARSCRELNVGRQTFYDWMKDPAFSERFHALRVSAAAFQEAELIRRGVEGVERLKFHEGEAIKDPRIKEDPNAPPGHDLYIEREYSDALLLRLLAANDPRYRPKAQVDLRNEVVLYASSDLIDKL